MQCTGPKHTEMQNAQGWKCSICIMQLLSIESEMAPERLESRRQQHPHWRHYSVLPWCQIVLSSGQSHKSTEEHMVVAIELGCQIPHLHTQFTALLSWRCSVRTVYKSEGILAASQWPVSTTVKLEPITNPQLPNSEIIHCFHVQQLASWDGQSSHCLFDIKLLRGEISSKILFLIKMSRPKNYN